jgi:hypothetical protein
MQQKQPTLFCGIGAARSGTTWLDYVLRQHGDISLPAVKEMHYFNWALDRDWIEWPQWKDALADLKTRILGQKAQAYLPNRFYHHARVRRFLLRGQPNHPWYRQILTTNRNANTVGEITPAYAALPEHAVEEMARVIPEARIFFVMRCPVDRIWSHYRYRIGLGRMPRDAVYSELDSFFSLRSSYERTMEMYERHFPASQIMYLFYEDLFQFPVATLNELCDFLCVSRFSEDQMDGFRERINASPASDCPDDIRAYLQEQVGSQIDSVRRRLGRVPAAWLEQD